MTVPFVLTTEVLFPMKNDPHYQLPTKKVVYEECFNKIIAVADDQDSRGDLLRDQNQWKNDFPGRILSMGEFDVFILASGEVKMKEPFQNQPPGSTLKRMTLFVGDLYIALSSYWLALRDADLLIKRITTATEPQRNARRSILNRNNTILDWVIRGRPLSLRAAPNPYEDMVVTHPTQTQGGFTVRDQSQMQRAAQNQNQIQVGAQFPTQSQMHNQNHPHAGVPNQNQCQQMKGGMDLNHQTPQNHNQMTTMSQTTNSVQCGTQNNQGSIIGGQAGTQNLQNQIGSQNMHNNQSDHNQNHNAHNQNQSPNQTQMNNQMSTTDQNAAAMQNAGQGINVGQNQNSATAQNGGGQQSNLDLHQNKPMHNPQHSGNNHTHVENQNQNNQIKNHTNNYNTNTAQNNQVSDASTQDQTQTTKYQQPGNQTHQQNQASNSSDQTQMSQNQQSGQLVNHLNQDPNFSANPYAQQTPAQATAPQSDPPASAPVSPITPFLIARGAEKDKENENISPDLKKKRTDLGFCTRCGLARASSEAMFCGRCGQPYA